MTKIVIRSVERPSRPRPDLILRWFCAEFGFSDDEEDNSIEEQILREFTDAARSNTGISSSQIRLEQPMARSTVIYHLNRFIDAGLIVKRGRQYYLRATELSKAIEEIEYDLTRELRKMMDTAREFDRLMSRRYEKRQKVSQMDKE